MCLRAISPSDKVQNEGEIRGSTPVSANDWGKNTAPVAVLIDFALYWASLILLRAMQLRVKLPCTIVVHFVDSFLGILVLVLVVKCMMCMKCMKCMKCPFAFDIRTRTRNRTNKNSNDTEASASGGYVRACNNRILRWAGHVARMPMSRAPRQLLTGWVLGIAFSTDWLSTDDLGQDVGERAQK